MAPASKAVQDSDTVFLIATDPRILDGSKVATTTATRLSQDGIDAERFARIMRQRGSDVVVAGYKIKLIEADPDTPNNFGVLVRLV